MLDYNILEINHKNTKGDKNNKFTSVNVMVNINALLSKIRKK